MKIKVTDAKIEKLKHECEIARKVMKNMDVQQPIQTDGEAELAAMTKPHYDKISTALDEIQSRAKVRLLRQYSLVDAARNAEKMLDSLNVPLKLRKGARFEVNAETGKIANAYKYPFSNSFATIERGANKAWFLVHAGRDTSFGGSNIEDRLLVSPAARKHAVRSLHESLVEGIAA